MKHTPLDLQRLWRIAPVEAGAHIAAVMGQILEKKKSGVAFAQEAGR